VTRSGPALIFCSRGVYVADHAEYDGRAVTFTGRLRVRDYHGYRLYEPRTFTLPIGCVEVEWRGQ
jgi:hypothetical protein